MSYKSHVRRRRGQCLSTLTALTLRAMVTYYMIRSYQIRGEPKRRWWNAPWASSFLTIFSENRSIQILCGDCYLIIHLVRWMPPPPTRLPVADRWLKIRKKHPPPVSRRGLVVGFIRIEDDFHGLGVNQIDSFLFLHSRNLGLHRS